MQLQLHYITQHYTKLIILHYGYSYDYNYTCNYHYTARHDPTPTTLDHITTTTTQPYTTLYHTAIHNTTIQYITIYYTNDTTTTTTTTNILHLLHITITTPHLLINMESHIQIGFCLTARSQNYTDLPDSWICGRLRVFAGVLRIFAGVLRVILGAVMCMYMQWCSHGPYIITNKI